MPEHWILIGAKDHITAVPPMNGETSWLRILYGHTADQIHIDRVAAKQLRDAITQALAELDEIEGAGPMKEQREQAALSIIVSHHMTELPARTQKKIHNKLANSATNGTT